MMKLAEIGEKASVTAIVCYIYIYIDIYNYKYITNLYAYRITNRLSTCSDTFSVRVCL